MMPDLSDNHPELLAVVQAIQSGPLGSNADDAQLAAGLRMVADAIDPPPCTCRPGLTCLSHQKELASDLAAMLARPKRPAVVIAQDKPVWVSEMPGPCDACGSLRHLTIAHPVTEVPQ